MTIRSRKYLQLPQDQLMVQWPQLPIEHRIEQVQDLPNEQLFEILCARTRKAQIDEAAAILACVSAKLSLRANLETEQSVKRLYLQLQKELTEKYFLVVIGDAGDFVDDSVARLNELAYRTHYWLNDPNHVPNLNRAIVAAERTGDMPLHVALFVTALTAVAVALVAATMIATYGASLALLILFPMVVGPLPWLMLKATHNPVGNAAKELMINKQNPQAATLSRTPSALFVPKTSSAAPTPTFAALCIESKAPAPALR